MITFMLTLQNYCDIKNLCLKMSMYLPTVPNGNIAVISIKMYEIEKTIFYGDQLHESRYLCER